MSLNEFPVGLKKDDGVKRFPMRQVSDFDEIIKQSGILYLVAQIKEKYPYEFVGGDYIHYGISKEFLEQNRESLLNLFYTPDVQKIDFSLEGLSKGNKKNVHVECRLKTTKSEYFWVEIKVLLNIIPEIEKEVFSVFISDITKRKLIEASLKYKMSFISSLIDSIPIPVYYKNINGAFLGVNTAYEKILNKNKNQIIGKHINEIIPEERVASYHLDEDDIIRSRKSDIMEDKILYSDNTYHDVIISRSIFYNANLTVGGIIGVINDITELKKKENAVIESEKNYRRLTSYLPEIVLVYSKGLIIFTNDILEHKLGFKVEEVINNSLFNIVAPQYHEKVKEIIKRRAAGEKIEDYKIELLKKEGGALTFIVRGSPILFMGQEGGVVVMIDITEKEKIDEQTRKSELQFRAIWESTFNGMRLINEEGVTTLVNSAYCNFVNKKKEELEGESFVIMYKPAEQQKKLEKLIERIKNEDIESQTKRKIEFWDGRVLWFEISNSLIKIPNHKTMVLSVFKDITEFVEIERQLSLSQKMESVGLLAAGIAHEINSPMQFIGDNNSFLRDSFKTLFNYVNEREKFVLANTPPEFIEKYESEIGKIREEFDIDFLLEEIPTAIDQTMTGIERVNKIIRALKDFAHPSSNDKSFADLNHGIEVTATISKNQWKYVADLVTVFDPDLPHVNCLLDEINQVILNMIINAAHAIQEKLGKEPSEKGLITIQTKREGDYAEVNIKDNGMGIKPENLNKIFDQFFTTKEIGKGTGQGLSIAHDIIVKRHNGFISVDSQRGVGTTFTIKLPIS